jgi:hypothetical protein
MLIEDLMTSIYKRFEKSSDTPDSSSEDYIVRLEFVNDAISKWENEIGITWKELYKTMSGTLVDGVCDDNVVTLLDFKRPAGSLFIGSDEYNYVRPENIQKVIDLTPSKKIYTVIGAKGSFEIDVYPVVSGTFSMGYIKEAYKYTSGTETTPEIEMSNHEFIINDVLAQLYLDDDNGTQANVKIQIASAKMDAMKLNNEIDPFNNNNNFTQDDDFDGFGVK